MQTKIRDKRVVYGVPVSDRIYEDNNGQLIIYDAILARTGSYDYKKSEIFDGLPENEKNEIIKVYRTPEEVFDPASMASFEHKPFCDNHPEDDVTVYNWKDLQKGYMFNIRRGKGEEQDCLIGDIVVMDPDTIEEIKNKTKRELSLGYNTEIVLGDDGKYYMTKIRGNHLALVDDGRAGIATIRDSNIVKNNTGGVAMQKAKSSRHNFFKSLYDEEGVDYEQSSEEKVEEEKENVMDEDLEQPEIVGVEEVVEDDDASEIELLKAILEKLDMLVSAVQTKSTDNDIVSVEEVSEDVPATDEDLPVPEEEKPSEEVVTEQTDEDVDTDMGKEEVPEEEEEDDKPEVFNSDEDMKEEEDLEDEDSEDIIKGAQKDSSENLYKQFVNVGDSANSKPESEQVAESFRQRYIKFGGKR